MIKSIQKNKFVKIFIVILIIVLLAYSFVILKNTFAAYKIVSNNYDSFNYPNTIKVHSGTIKASCDWTHFVCRISAENSYGQRIYDGFLASKDGIFSFEWYEENGMDVGPSMRKDSRNTNVSIFLLNFLISMDW